MCLIITGQASKVRTTLLDTEGLLLDIFKTNPDGIGVMYATKNKLKIVKKLPQSLEQARQFIERMPTDERLMAIHFRWTTHGDTDLENCHPYTVVEGEVALMHNGVLRYGNADDRTKSDTWHFIKNYLTKAVEMAPGIVFDPGYAAMLKDFIGSSNRFVLMSKDGRQIVLNKKEGIEHDGMWFSNSYAWTPKLLIENYQKYGYTSYGGGFQGGFQGSHQYNGFEGDDEVYDWTGGIQNRQWQGGGQSSGTKSITHNKPVLPEGTVGRGATQGISTPAPQQAAASSVSGAVSTIPTGTAASNGATFTQADAQAEAEWERTVRQSHLEWNRDRRPARAAWRFGGSSPAVGGEVDPPEEGKAGDASAPGNAVSTDAPRRGELVQALVDADVEKFENWLMAYPQVTLGILFHLYRAGPTKYTTKETLGSYEQKVYEACLVADRTFLIAEARKEDGSSGVLAEVICYYLNWYAWPNVVQQEGTDVVAIEASQPPAEVVEPREVKTFPFPTAASAAHDAALAVLEEPEVDTLQDVKGDSHISSEAQLGQGGEGSDERDNSMYIG